MPAKVTDYTAAKVISVAPDTGVGKAGFTLREHGIRHLPVVEPDGKPAGSVSDRELRRPGLG